MQSIFSILYFFALKLEGTHYSEYLAKTQKLKIKTTDHGSWMQSDCKISKMLQPSSPGRMDTKLVFASVCIISAQQ